MDMGLVCVAIVNSVKCRLPWMERGEMRIEE
jgi:hypothetical protein